jgi:hypothetical protein
MLNWNLCRTKRSRPDFWYYSSTEEHRKILNEQSWCPDQDSEQEHMSEALGLEPFLSDVFGCQFHYSLHLTAGLTVSSRTKRKRQALLSKDVYLIHVEVSFDGTNRFVSL